MNGLNQYAVFFSNELVTKQIFPKFSSGVFSLVDTDGKIITEENQLGLLLYKGGTVCDDYFTNKTADAICREMNFVRAERWTSEESFEIQSDYNINLDDTKCSNDEWRECNYSEEHNCEHIEDVFLSCTHGR